jgi:hypothetical protein
VLALLGAATVVSQASTELPGRDAIYGITAWNLLHLEALASREDPVVLALES